MIEWRSDSGVFDTPCDLCRLLRLSHDDETMGHEWRASESEIENLAEKEQQARINTLMGELRGEYDAPLPPPTERRRIREAARWTQQQIADELHVSRHALGRFERPAAWLNGRRLPGREPSGAVRADYSALLKGLLVGDG